MSSIVDMAMFEDRSQAIPSKHLRSSVLEKHLKNEFGDAEYITGRS